MTQNNLGEAYRILGERESGTATLERAVEAFEAGLEIFEAAKADYFVGIATRNLERTLALIDERSR